MNKNQEPYDYLAKWRLSNPLIVASTPRATLWRVTCSDGTYAALKIATGSTKASEAGADDTLAAFRGAGMVRCLRTDQRAWLLEWIEGPTLGDVARNGNLDEADKELVVACARLHANPVASHAPLQSLAETVRPLQVFDLGRLVLDADRAAFRAAQEILGVLQAKTSPSRLLHGDFHHDNVAHGARGWLAFDPKGVIGDLAFEPANAFANPVGCEKSAYNPDRIDRLADDFSQALAVDRDRVLGWAVVHSALSMVWSLEDEDEKPLSRLPLLSTLLDFVK